jgi:hypothetical protein
MFIAVPVMDACNGLAKNIIALAISVGDTNLPIGCLASSAALAAFASAD